MTISIKEQVGLIGCQVWCTTPEYYQSWLGIYTPPNAVHVCRLADNGRDYRLVLIDRMKETVYNLLKHFG